MGCATDTARAPGASAREATSGRTPFGSASTISGASAADTTDTRNSA
ncbi:MAG: hypothetical protein M5R40_24075 [Anaerolineae bacterium]|nr:hypothetical protein [Anaerolineae bacterium]